MDPEDETGSSGQGQNLHDLQNYLSTFNKEIEPGDDVLSSMDVDTGVGDVSDLYTTSGNSLQDPGEGGVASQFSSGFYSEQSILDTTLSDETAQQIENLEAATDGDTETEMGGTIKQEVGGAIDLEAVQAQIVGFGETQLSQGMGDMQTSGGSQGLIMASPSDGLDPNSGKVIRIVSLGEDIQFLSLGDGSHMQILNQDLGIPSDPLTSADSVLNLQGSETTTVSPMSAPPTSILTPTNTTNMVEVRRGSSTMTSINTKMDSASDSPNLVSLQNTSSDSCQSQLVAIPQGLTAESLQMSSLLSGDNNINSGLGYQTITILPSEINQNGDMNYVLIMAPSDTNKDTTQPGEQLLDLKQENQELSEELVEINGQVKRVLRVVPKKYLAASFGSQLMCEYCDYTSPKRYLLTRHMKSHSDERPHKCKECDRGFKTPASLMNHINTHTGTRPHKCKTCEAAFTTSGELVRHIRYRHTFEKPHRCPNCDYASVELSKLKRHMRSHTGERPYKCPHCPYASPDTYKLKRHLRIHTGEKPYECDICHARFTQSNSLKAHKLIHSGNKPVFQCNLCPTTCGRKTDLKIHFNKLHSVGSPLECKKCGQVFSDRYSYKQHVRGHDIDKCFKCEECDFIANTEKSFDAHAAIHSSGKKFDCHTCHMSFNLKQTLDRHKLSCNLSFESGVDSPSSGDKESTVDQNIEKSSVYKNVLGRPSVQSKIDSSLLGCDVDSSTSSQVNQGPLASDTLHKNLLQDIKAGKLGDVPQVVIVHPDGSLEEISSKLPAGDKLNIEEIFSALSSNDKLSGTSKESKDGKPDDGGDKNPEREDNCEIEEADNEASSQCEASTQAELESDTDSVEDNADQASPKLQLDKKEKSPTISVANLHTVCDTESTSSLTSPGVFSSLISTVTTSGSQMSTSLPPCLAKSSSESSLVTGSNQQYVMVKGYTCLTTEPGQPTLVNVAVDKESLMKMFVSLGSSSDTGLPILAGDSDTTETFALGRSHGHISTSLQDVSDVSNVNISDESHVSIRDESPVNIADESHVNITDESHVSDTGESLAIPKVTVVNETPLLELCHLNQTASLSSEEPEDKVNTSLDELGTKVNYFPSGQPRLQQETNFPGRNHPKVSSHVTALVADSKSLTQNLATSLTSPSFSSPFVSVKISKSSQKVDTKGNTACSKDSLPPTKVDYKQVKLTLGYDGGNYQTGTQAQESRSRQDFPQSSTLVCINHNSSTSNVTAMPGSTSRLLSQTLVDTEEDPSTDSLEVNPSLLRHGLEELSSGEAMQKPGQVGNLSTPLCSGNDEIPVVNEKEKQKRSNRKRLPSTESSVIRTGKRIRKALVKVSM